jgi:2'-5' RNA ligase
MLESGAEHATQLRNHWYWRPGHRPGRPFYTWHLTFDGQPDLHRLVTDYHQALRDLPGLDLVPIPWLHITMQGIGFADEVPDTDRDAIIDAASRRLATIPPPTLTFHHITIRPEAITLYPNPTEPVRTIRAEIRQAIADVWGINHVPDAADTYQPHLSIAYVNSHAEAPCIVEVLSAKNPDPARVVVTFASCIAQQRVNHSYQWDTHAAAHFAG